MDARTGSVEVELADLRNTPIGMMRAGGGRKEREKERRRQSGKEEISWASVRAAVENLVTGFQ